MSWKELTFSSNLLQYFLFCSGSYVASALYIPIVKQYVCDHLWQVSSVVTGLCLILCGIMGTRPSVITQQVVLTKAIS